MSTPAFKAAKATFYTSMAILASLVIGSVFGSMIGSALLFLKQFITFQTILVLLATIATVVTYVLYYRHYKLKAFFEKQEKRKSVHVPTI